MLDLFTVGRLIDLWLAEDIGHGDLTALSMIEPDAKATFHMNAREELSLAGVDVAAMCFKRYDPNVSVEVKTQDGTRCKKSTPLLAVSGSARSLLTVERTALNITQHLSGIATETARWMAEIKGTKAQLIDTRKTTPGLRALEKHAVVCGGGANHRLGLDGGVMIKDNHIAVAGSITKAVQRARSRIPGLVKIEVECDRMEQVKEAVEAKADIIMLDNMPLDQMREAVKFVGGRIPLEASGGVRFSTVRAIAETGVDYVSTSKTIQAAPAVDIGLDDA
jgi:nicotinate-nucleotide pyrophosphorylase (carboxylating)